jgi:hypothetical protein
MFIVGSVCCGDVLLCAECCSGAEDRGGQVDMFIHSAWMLYGLLQHFLIISRKVSLGCQRCRLVIKEYYEIIDKSPILF